MSQSAKNHLTRNGYSPRREFVLDDRLTNNSEFRAAYPHFDSSGLLFGTTNEKSVNQYIVRAKYPKPGQQAMKYLSEFR